jgi:hypothetical protein
MRRPRHVALQELRRGLPSLCRGVPQDGRLIRIVQPAPSVMTSVLAHRQVCLKEPSRKRRSPSSRSQQFLSRNDPWNRHRSSRPGP